MLQDCLYACAVNLLVVKPASVCVTCARVCRWWQLPYFWAGIKAYDLVSGSKLLKSSYLLSKTKALELFPMLKRDKLVGAIVYYDGETAVSLVLLSGGDFGRWPGEGDRAPSSTFLDYRRKKVL